MPPAASSLLRGAAVLLLATLTRATASDLAPPSGSAPVGRWAGPISGLPNSKLPDAPALGNGYAGLLLGTGAQTAAFAGTVELWLNTNAMWGCTPGPTGPNALPVPALCSRVGLGGVRFTPVSAAAGVALGPFKIRAEQHITNATLRTIATTAAGSTLETTTFMAPEANVIITSMSWIAAGADPKTLTINVSAWVYAVGGEVLLEGSSGGGGGALIAVRNSSEAAGGNSSSYRRVRTAIVVALVEKGAALANAAIGAEQSRLVAFGTTVLTSSAPPTNVITALSDTLVSGNDHDPVSDAAALAHSISSASAVAADASTYWSDFWAKSSISLPDAPQVEAFWRGAQYISACMSASKKFLAKQQGLIPPSGLYGPWVTTDRPSWNGDYTLDYNQGQFLTTHAHR
jgi:hypothetical protein